MKVIFKSESTLTELEPDNAGARKEHDRRAVYSHEQTALLNCGYAFHNGTGHRNIASQTSKIANE